MRRYGNKQFKDEMGNFPEEETSEARNKSGWIWLTLWQSFSPKFLARGERENERDDMN